MEDTVQLQVPVLPLKSDDFFILRGNKVMRTGKMFLQIDDVVRQLLVSTRQFLTVQSAPVKDGSFYLLILVDGRKSRECVCQGAAIHLS
ncbi:hypothetical protein DQ04_02311120 [Trypanosoma grayi]|uniref:hypothetical protein n=1 Tax=Trypanosoma grayi TaxID=71804 RepID=UPI0004F42CB0|nr:hypothetical protein DQ04_02311120 [Trypanosoma grayi]KEG11760.1 hypothetical protein DQ04_02311120 [Trypanosoma grayi]